MFELWKRRRKKTNEDISYGRISSRCLCRSFIFLNIKLLKTVNECVYVPLYLFWFAFFLILYLSDIVCAFDQNKLTFQRKDADNDDDDDDERPNSLAIAQHYMAHIVKLYSLCRWHDTLYLSHPTEFYIPEWSKKKISFSLSLISSYSKTKNVCFKRVVRKKKLTTNKQGKFKQKFKILIKSTEFLFSFLIQ